MMTPYNSDIICTQNYSECMYWKENMVMPLPLHCVKICKKLVQKPGQKSWLNLSFLKVPEVALVDIKVGHLLSELGFDPHCFAK